MSNEFINKVKSDFFPAKNDLIEANNVPKEAAKLGVKASMRTLQRDVKAGLLPRPIRLGEGRKVYYYRTFILAELLAIQTFKDSFHCTLIDLKHMAHNNKNKNFQEMLNDLHALLNHIHRPDGVIRGKMPLIFEVGNDKYLHQVAFNYIAKLKKGEVIPNKNTEKFIKEMM